MPAPLPCALRDHRDRRNELIAAAADRQDGLLQLAAVAENLARALDVIAQRRIRDLAPVPDFPEQLLPGQDPIAVPDQVHQQIEHLRFRGDDGVPAADPVAGRIDDVFGYLVFHSAGIEGSPRIVIKSLPKNYAAAMQRPGRPANVAPARTTATSGEPTCRRHCKSCWIPSP